MNESAQKQITYILITYTLLLSIISIVFALSVVGAWYVITGPMC